MPGLQLDARIADDPAGEARILIRLPDQWNGKLVVAGSSGTRSEFNGDFAWSDYVVQKGYAYVSQNKGIINFRVASFNSATPPDALSCRLNPASTIWVDFYANDPATPFTRWTPFMIEATRIGANAISVYYGHRPRRTYAVGTSNGGYQVRRALEAAPQLYDGGIDWEGTYVDPVAPNILSGLPPAILNFADYAASGFSPGSTAAKNIVLTGYPPDLVSGTTSLGGFTRPAFGRSPSVNGKNVSILITILMGRALVPIAMSTDCRPPMSARKSPQLRPPATSESR